MQPLSIIAEHEARLRAIDAVNRIVLSSLAKSGKTDDLVTFIKDHTGKIQAYRVNTQFVNQVASEVAVAIHNEFDQHRISEFHVPLGVLTGSAVLATKGPRIGVSLVPVGTVAIDLEQEFKGEGINQTRHRIWLRAVAHVQIVLPFVTKEIEVATSLPITETVIIGPVPTSFYGGNLGGLAVPVPSAPVPQSAPAHP